MKKHLRKILCVLIFISACSFLNAQTPIPPDFFGQNAWMVDSVGTCSINEKCLFFGKLDSNNWTNVFQSTVRLIRVGGEAFDDTSMSDYQYLKRIDSIRSYGMEPILQVPFDNGGYDSSKASALVTLVNVTNNKAVKYWSIGNEPTTYAGNKYATQIADYTKKFSIAMKRVDSTIRIIGPDLVKIDDPWTTDAAFMLADSLTSKNISDTIFSVVGTIPNNSSFGKAAGKGIIDYFSYHIYHYNGATDTMTRAWLISRLTAAGKDTARMGWLKRRCDDINTHRASQPLKPVITEANICHNDSATPPYNDNWQGVKTSSFFAGQHWAEMAALGIFQGIQ